MSSQGEPPIEDIGPDFVADAEGELYTMGIYGDAEAVSAQPTEADAKLWVTRRGVSIATTQSANVVKVYTATWDAVQQAWDDGELPYTDTVGFFGWLRYNQGIVLITSALLASGAMAAWLATYAGQKGYPIPATAPAPTPFVPTGPSGATIATRNAYAALTPTTVPAPGLTPQETAAISKAITAGLSDANKVSQAALDSMLPGLAPGQVPQALDQLNTAVGVLEHQLWDLSQTVVGRATGSIAGMLHGLQETVAGMGQAVNLLYEQVHLTAESPMGDELATTATRAQANTTAIADLATTTAAAEAALTTRADNFEHQLAMTAPSIMGEELGQVAGTANAAQTDAQQALAKLALTTDECLAQLCSDQANVTDPITGGGATPSLLRQLGSLLGIASLVGLVTGFADTVLAVLDVQVAVQGVVADTETLSNWAIQAAGAITSDLSWKGALPVG